MALGAVGPARAQSLPAEPYVVGDGRLTIGGDLSATTSCASTDVAGAASCTEDPGFFNYTDYDHSVVRMVRIGVTAALRASRHFSVLGELRSENAGSPEPYALYLRFRPWVGRNLDVQVGRVPPTFGAFARRTYASDNILIGYPLAYQYLTSLRPDSLPANADELLRMRGRGWLSNFSVGDPTPRHGMPVASAFRWDTGVQLHAAAGIVEGAASVTMGTLANPLVKDDNSGKQYSGRLTVRPATGLIVGVSAARGPFVTRQAAEAAGLEDQGGPIHADRLGRRRGVFVELLPDSGRDDSERLDAADRASAGVPICRFRRSRPASRGATRSIRPGFSCRPRASTHLGSAF